MTNIAIKVNKESYRIDVAPDTPLLWVLRDTLGLTGTKYGCGMGLCGACTVHLDGEARRSCQTPVGSIGAKRITTIEGLSPDCSQSGQIMQAAAFLARTPHPTREQIDEAMNGNICRCATYQRIRRAIQFASGQNA